MSNQADEIERLKRGWHNALEVSDRLQDDAWEQMQTAGLGAYCFKSIEEIRGGALWFSDWICDIERFLEEAIGLDRRNIIWTELENGEDIVLVSRADLLRVARPTADEKAAGALLEQE